MPKLAAVMAALLIGPVVGSFVTNWALRWARGEQALVGRSRCDNCAVELGFAQTTPLISYVLLKGRCSACRSPIDPLHPAGEIAGGLVLALSLTAPTPWEAGLRVIVGFCLLALIIIDLKIMRLPNRLTALTAIGCAAIAVLRGELLQGLIAATIIGSLFLLLRRVIRKGDTPGLGLGDVKLAAGLCLWLGLASTWMVALASCAGVLAAILTRSAHKKTPYGPALAVAAIVIVAMRDWGLLSGWI